MTTPSFLQNLADTLAVTFIGGVRVRILDDDGALIGVTKGRTPGPPPDKILSLILDLHPDGTGTIDLHHDGRGNWRIQLRGPLSDAAFQQRLRNVLVNS